jgi:serum/glucocorticoid-regulated kinase 2
MYRDLKPENLMINDDGYLKLIDFGCAKIIENDELSCSLIGNPYYMSPEIISGEGHNFSTDWWSFGVILYELFFGVPPFNDRNLERNFDLIRNCNVIFPSNKFISKELKDLIMKLLEKNKEKRLGFKNGFNEIIQHQFFKNGANIINILNKSLIPSFKPNNEKLFENFDEIYTNLEINMNENYENEKIQNLQKYESLFEIFIKK